MRVRAGEIAEVGRDLGCDAEKVVDAGGAALLPGLHDHHIHLLAWAAARESVPCGPPQVRSPAELAARLGAARPRDGWVRGVGYHEAVAGDLDAAALDGMRGDVPVRVQHRSGALWVVNSAAVIHLGLADVTAPGVERSPDGRPTGRLWRMDRWLADRVDAWQADLAGVWTELASYGVVGVTDATPGLDAASAAFLRSTARGRITLLGAADEPAQVPVKIVVPDHALPGLDELADTFRRARPRPVALHCVTRAALFLCVAALYEAGSTSGDRIEHAAVVPSDALPAMRELGLTVVTQPSFIATRGDDYLRDVDDADQPYLWPYASLLRAGIPVAMSSDAPYGSPDPWQTIAAAVSRRTSSGAVLGAAERVAPQTVLRGLLAPLEDPGGPPRRVAVGQPADLLLLDRPLPDALAEPSRDAVRLTMVGGEVTYFRDDA